MPGIENSVYISHSHDPWLNLAIEDWLYQNIRPDQRVLFLSRNETSVVIGRFQNPWLECNVAKMQADGIPLVRRQSGGGTVYHDLGNTNYSFISPKELYDVDLNYAVLLRALKSLGVDAERTERNDLYLKGRKFSGSAFKKTAYKTIHHGTLLHRADSELLREYLKISASSLKGRGIRSVPAEVVNLSDAAPGIDHERLVDAIIREFESGGREVRRREMDEGDALKIEALRERYEEYRSWEWTFGKMPPFTQILQWRNGGLTLEMSMDVKHCIIENISLTSVHEMRELSAIAELLEELQGIPYRRAALQSFLKEYFAPDRSYPPVLRTFGTWLAGQIYPS